MLGFESSQGHQLLFYDETFWSGTAGEEHRKTDEFEEGSTSSAGGTYIPLRRQISVHGPGQHRRSLPKLLVDIYFLL